MKNQYFQVPHQFLDRMGRLGPAAVAVYLQICGRLSAAAPSAAISTAELACLADLSQRTGFSAVSRLRDLDLLTSPEEC